MSIIKNRYAPGNRLPRHAHDGATISIVACGWQVERIAARDHRRDPLSVVYKPTGLEHENTIGGEPTVALFVDVPDSVASLFASRERIATDRADAPEVRLLAARLIAAPSADETDELVLAVLAALHDDRSRSSAPGWLRRCRDALHDQFAAPPSLTELATLAGVHPVHVAHAFRRYFGVTTREVIRRVRVARAARLVIATRTGLAEIAHSTGFTDQSHMTRAFHATIGMTPGTLRRSSTA